jgi:predicted nuclease of predicted toxin-antitoxin system
MLKTFIAYESSPVAIMNTLFITKDTDFLELSCTILRYIKAQCLFISIAERLEFYFLLAWTRLQKQESVRDAKLLEEMMSVFNPFKYEVKQNTI